MRGKIRVGGEWLYCDGLSRRTGEKVEIQRAKYLRWDGVPVWDRKGVFLGVAHLDEEHERGAVSGPIESARRRKVAFDISNALVREVDDEKAVNLMVAAGAAVPALPKPKSAGKIKVAPDAEAIASGINTTLSERRTHKATAAQKAQEARLALLERMGGGR